MVVVSAAAILLAPQFEGHEIRVVGTADAPEWVAQDVCDALGIRSARSALRKFSDDQKGVHSVHTLGGEQDMLTVTEAGLYRLVFRSSRPEAERFQRWVFHEVLPAIRRTGTYAAQGMVMVRQDAWEQSEAAIAALSDAYVQQAEMAAKAASLAASLLALRRHAKPKDDPRQALIHFEPLGQPARIGGAS